MAFDIYKYITENKFNVSKVDNGFNHGEIVIVRPENGKPFKDKVAKTQLSENTVNLQESGTWDIKLVQKENKNAITEAPKYTSFSSKMVKERANSLYVLLGDNNTTSGRDKFISDLMKLLEKHSTISKVK